MQFHDLAVGMARLLIKVVHRIQFSAILLASGHMPIARITLSLGAAREIPVQSGYYNTGTLPPMRYLSNDNITLQWSYVQCLRWIIGSSERMLHRMNDIRIVCDVIGYRLKLPIKNSRIVQEASKICKIVFTKETMAPSCRDTLFLLVSNPLVPLSLNDIHPSEEVKDSWEEGYRLMTRELITQWLMIDRSLLQRKR